MPLPVDPRDPVFLQSVDAVSRKMGKTLLQDHDLVLIACEEISRTVTHEEKNYQAPVKDPS
ncbi:MAG: hypothetical protein JXA71_05165 [Chitinispirillaceae bacterium]|nr:hypothetical protein [Chitinispirillaceae bacterium]